MRNLTDANPLQLTVSPSTVFTSTTPGQSSFANVVVNIENNGTEALSVDSIAITLPQTLTPAQSLGGITLVVNQPNLWNFTPSQINAGEFDATPVSGSYADINAGNTWNFALNMVTLVSTITQPAADVSVDIIFNNGTSYNVSLNVNIEAAVASIISFNSEPANIAPGQTATLSWQCEKIDYCVIGSATNAHLPSSGSLEVTPNEITSYTLYAYADGIILSAQWVISVDNAQIVQFGGIGGQTSTNYGGNITLVWECNQFTNNITLVAAPDTPIPGLLTGSNTYQNGSIVIGPLTEPTTYIFTAYGGQQFTQLPVTIGVDDLACSFYPTPGTEIWTGDEVTLTWNIENASGVSISPEVENGPSLQNPAGSAVVNPTAGVTYILSVSGFTGNEPVSSQYPVLLAVQQVVINSFTASPNPITPDQGRPNQATFSWDTQAEVVSIDNGVGNQPAVGSVLLNAPNNGAVYTLTAGTTLNPNLQTAMLTIANSFGPFTFTSFAPHPDNLYGTDFTVPNPGPEWQFAPICLATLTGVTGTFPDGTTPDAYAAIPFYNGAQSILTIMPWPATNTVSFTWADPNSQAGTIMLSPKSGNDE